MFFSEKSHIVVNAFLDIHFVSPGDDMLRNFPIHRPRKGDHIFVVSLEEIPVDTHFSVVVSFFLSYCHEFDQIEVSMVILREKHDLIEIIIPFTVLAALS